MLAFDLSAKESHQYTCITYFAQKPLDQLNKWPWYLVCRFGEVGPTRFAK